MPPPEVWLLVVVVLVPPWPLELIPPVPVPVPPEPPAVLEEVLDAVLEVVFDDVPSPVVEPPPAPVVAPVVEPTLALVCVLPCVGPALPVVLLEPIEALLVFSPLPVLDVAPLLVVPEPPSSEQAIRKAANTGVSIVAKTPDLSRSRLVPCMSDRWTGGGPDRVHFIHPPLKNPDDRSTLPPGRSESTGSSDLTSRPAPGPIRSLPRGVLGTRRCACCPLPSAIAVGVSLCSAARGGWPSTR